MTAAFSTRVLVVASPMEFFVVMWESGQCRYLKSHVLNLNVSDLEMANAYRIAARNETRELGEDFDQGFHVLINIKLIKTFKESEWEDACEILIERLFDQARWHDQKAYSKCA